MACMTTPAGTPSESAVTPAAPMLVLDRKSNGRAIYDPEAKRALVQQCLQPGVSVAATALRAGVNANLLRKWITKHQRAIGERATAPPSTIAGDLMPVVLRCDAAAAMTAAPASGSLAGAPTPITIELHGARVHVASGVDPTTLAAVVRALRATA